MKARHAVSAPLALLHRAEIRACSPPPCCSRSTSSAGSCDADGPRAPLSVRHHAARRRADQRRRFHARRQAGDRAACSTSSASTMSRAAIRAPIRPTANCSRTERELNDDLHRLRHDAAARPLDLERSGPRRAARRQGRRHLLRRQVLGLSRARRAGDHATRKTSPRSATACAPPRPRAAKCCSTASISSTATRPTRHTRWPAPRRPTTRARAGSCCATPMAARCRTRSRRSSARSCKAIPGDHVGIHAHNDTEQAVANSFAAVRAGARQIQGTLNGLGERCGNANLVSIIPTLKLKPEFADQFEIGVSDEALKKLAHVSHALDERLNRAPNRHAPYVGESAFATKAGIHASAIVKEPATYEHVAPEAVGNRRKVLVSEQAGKSNVLAELERIGIKVDKDDPRIGAPAGDRQGARGHRLCLRGRRRLVRIAGAAHARHRAELFRRHAVRRQCRAAQQRARRARHRHHGGGEGEGRRRHHDLGGGRQRPGQCARPGAAQGPRQVPEIHRAA